ncbi:cation transporter [Hyphococcus sp.]|uniref:cation transporter n=1 Tax=Hyphococcus sp. TaxID=2038636 RepID=UPI003D0B7EF7
MSAPDFDLNSLKKRRTLYIVLALNVAIAAGFFVSGAIADSNALIANGLDNSSDAVVYFLSILALTRSRSWKRNSARFSGMMLAVFAIGVVIDALRRFLAGSEPIGAIMMVMALVAGVINLISLYLLKKLKSPGVNLRAATTFSFNDFISNGGIIIAGVVVTATGANWPDLVVGVAVAGIALYGSIEILRDAHDDKHEERGDVHQ